MSTIAYYPAAAVFVPGDDVRLERRERDGLREIEPLNAVAAFCTQERELLGRLDALGDDLEIERVRHRDHGADDRRVFGLVREIGHERAVDLDRVEREPPQIAERRIAGAEIVDREAHALGAEIAHDADRQRGVVHRDGFGDLEFERGRIEPACARRSARIFAASRC